MTESPSEGERAVEPICTVCGTEFSTVRGMRVHHTKVHGTPLPNRACRNCTEPFYDPYGQRVLCDDCRVPRTGESRWEHGNTEASCIECGATFLYYPSEKRGLFCPDCVQDDGVPCVPPKADTTDGRTSVECAQCRTSLDVPASKASQQDRLFCDRECYATWLAEERRQNGVWADSANPNWHEGSNREGRYGEGWPSARKRTLDRDEYTCQRCGTPCTELGRNPDVHHIEPVRTFDDPVEAHTLDNLVCLCRACHLEVERFGGTVEGGI